MPASPSQAEAPLLKLTLPAEAGSVPLARQAVLAALAGARPSDRVIYQLELVLEELLMNVVMHAFPAGGKHEMGLTLHRTPDALVLGFEDDGVAFDPLHAMPPRPATSLDDAAPGGRGLLLVRSTARSCAYERVGARNRLTVHLALDDR